MEFIMMGGPFKKVFNPLQLSGLSLWLDASDSSTIGLVGNKVTLWRDKGPNGYDLIQNSDSKRGILRLSEQNGKNAIGFSNSQYLGSSTASGQNIFGTNGDTFTYFIVNKCPLNNKNSQLGYDTYIDLDGNLNGSRLTEAIVMSSFYSDTGANEYFLVCDSPQTNGRYIKTISQTFFGDYNYSTFYRNGSNVEGFVNGVSQGISSVTSTPSNFTGQAVLSVGDVSVQTNPAEEQIAEIIVYNKVLTQNDIKKVENYLKVKYAL